MASLSQDEIKTIDDGDGLINEDSSNEVGNQIIDNISGTMWSIGNNECGQHGNETMANVEQLTLHQWAKDLDIIKVVSNGMNLFTLHFQS